MSTQKHTQGNWKLNNNSISEHETRFSVSIDDNLGYAVIATITDDNNMIGRKEVEANAKLIAAAPELLKICTDLMDAFVHKENDKRGNQARTDIFKYCPEYRDIAVEARRIIEKITK